MFGMNPTTQIHDTLNWLPFGKFLSFSENINSTTIKKKYTVENDGRRQIIQLTKTRHYFP